MLKGVFYRTERLSFLSGFNRLITALIIFLGVLFFSVKSASAATYYMRADGTAVFITISGASNQGGQVRLTTSTDHGFTQGDTISIGGIVGTTEANGTWVISNVSDSTHFDIPVTFVNSWVSGGKAIQAGPCPGVNCTAAKTMSFARHGTGTTFVPGDIFYLSSAGGDYSASSLNAVASGTSGNPIQYINVSGETPTIGGTMIVSLSTRNYITIDGLTFTGGSTYSMRADSGVGIVAKNITCNTNQSYCIFFNGTTGEIRDISGTANVSLLYLRNNPSILVDGVVSDSSGGQVVWLYQPLVANVNNLTISHSQHEAVRIQDIDNMSVTGENWDISYAGEAGSGVLHGVFYYGAGATNVSLNLSNITVSNSAGDGLRFADGSSFTEGSKIDGFDISYSGNNGILATSIPNFQILNGRSHHNSGSGIYINSSSNNIITGNEVDNNGIDGIATDNGTTDTTVTRNSAHHNGTIDDVNGGNGDGYTTHTGCTNQYVANNLFYNNTNTGVAPVLDSTGSLYNNIIVNNGCEQGSVNCVYRGTRGGFYNSGTGTWVVKNNVFQGNNPYEVNITSTVDANSTFNFNQYYHVGNSVVEDDAFKIGGNVSSWTNYHSSNEDSSQYGDPLLTDTAAYDFSLQSLSPAIDSGIAISGLTSDYSGNSYFGTVDIGAYEYQPPYTMGTDELDIDGDVRIYADGKFRDTQSPSGTTADLSITPVGGFGSGDYSEWMNIAISTWNMSDTYKKVWSETSSSIGSGSTVHTVGDLRANQRYLIKVDNVLGANITGANCSGNYCTSNSSGEISFTYTGGYSTVSFDVEEDSTDPAASSLISPSGFTKDNTKPMLSFRKSSDTNGISSYTVTLDSGKNKSYSTSGIPASGNGSSSYIWKDDGDVKIEFLNEDDSDSSNDEIRVYFKGLDNNELTEGKHTWEVKAYDVASNETSQSTDFYLDKSLSSVSELAIADFSTVTSEVTYNLNIKNRTPSFSGLATDLYQGSTVTNSNGTKDIFDAVSSGPKTISLVIKRLEGEDYKDYISKEFSLSDTTNVENDKKFSRFFITTPFPLIDGKYEVQLFLKDGAGNTYEQPDFYLSINSGQTNLIRTLLTGQNLETEIVKQETNPIETEEEKQEIQEKGYEVKIKVVDKEKNPVKGARVTIHSKVQETTTDEDGIAQFFNVEPGDHKVLIAYDNYKGEQEISLSGDVKEFSLTIRVEETAPFSTNIERIILGTLVLIVLGLMVLVYKARKLRK